MHSLCGAGADRDLVAVSAKLVYTGRTSMHFAIDVRVRCPMGGNPRLCAHCIIVFVAMDPNGITPVAVPSRQPDTREDQRLAE